MNDYIDLLLEEQFLARVKNSLQATDQYLKARLKQNKYDVEANKKRPAINKDLRYVDGLLSGMHQELLKMIEKKYDYEFQSIKIQREENEQVPSDQDGVPGEDLRQPEGGSPLKVVGPEKESL